jgi:transposase
MRSQSGRPNALSPNKITRIQELLDQPGHTIASVAKLFGVSSGTIYRNVLGRPPKTGESSPP